MNRAQKDLEAALKASTEQQERIRRENAAVNCQWCYGTGDVHDLTGEWRGECVCGAADNKKGDKQ